MMKCFFLVLTLIFIIDGSYSSANGQTVTDLKIVIIRHGEKEISGDNLSCQGLNRALLLPKIMVHKFGVPALIYVPSINSGKATSHSRMFQTASPLAIKYNLTINTNYGEDDFLPLAEDLETMTGTVFVIWEHKTITRIIKALGVKAKGIKWPDDDFDSIWIVTFNDGKAVLTIDKEGLKPAATCQF